MKTRKKPYIINRRYSALHSFEAPVNATIELLDLAGIEVAVNDLNEDILSHPDYPSLLCISDSLNDQKIGNIATRVNKEKLDEYPLPMLVHLNGQFGIIKEVKEKEIVLLEADGNPVSVNKEKFLADWNGIVLLIDNEENEEKDLGVNRRKKERPAGLPLSFLAVAVVLVAAMAISPSVPYIIMLLLKSAGIIVTSLLLWYSIDKKNQALKKLCGANSTKPGCSAILDSSKANLVKGLSWSEIGAFYFWGSLFTLLFFPRLIFEIAWINLLALPFTVYSLVYQGLIVKNWCRLCLAVQGILVIEAISSFFFHLHGDILPLTAVTVFQLFVSFMLPVFAWYAIKPLLNDKFKNKNLRFEFARLKRNPAVVSAILQQQNSLPVNDGIGIAIGNKKAAHTVVTVSNPYCPPCAKTHLDLDKLVETGDVKAKLLFTATAEPADKKTPVVEHLLAIAEKADENITRKALDDWYKLEEKDYKRFAETYKMNGELKQQDKKIKIMADWCKAAGITHTPTIYVDGKELPGSFSLSDLKYLFAG